MMAKRKYYSFILIYWLVFLSISFYFLSLEGSQIPADTTVVEKVPNPIGVPVLGYHQIVSDEKARQKNNSFIMGISQFRRQMEYLKEQGYSTISLAQLKSYIEGENIALPAKPIVITFDDGTKGFFKLAREVLIKANFRAVLFVYPNATGRTPAFLTWDELTILSQEGHEIQAHAFTHPLLTSMNYKSQLSEFRHAKNRLEKKLVKPVDWLAYPFGAFNLYSVDAMKEAGYNGAFTVFNAQNVPGQNLFFLNRYLVVRFQNMEEFKRQLEFRGFAIKKVEPRQGTIVKAGDMIKLWIDPNLDKKLITIKAGGSFLGENTPRDFEYNVNTGEITLHVKRRTGRYYVVQVHISSNEGYLKRATALYLM